MEVGVLSHGWGRAGRVREGFPEELTCRPTLGVWGLDPEESLCTGPEVCYRTRDPHSLSSVMREGHLARGTGAGLSPHSPGAPEGVLMESSGWYAFLTAVCTFKAGHSDSLPPPGWFVPPATSQGQGEKLQPAPGQLAGPAVLSPGSLELYCKEKVPDSVPTKEAACWSIPGHWETLRTGHSRPTSSSGLGPL